MSKYTAWQRVDVNTEIIILTKSNYDTITYNPALAIKEKCNFILRHLKANNCEDLKQLIRKLYVIISIPDKNKIQEETS